MKTKKYKIKVDIYESDIWLVLTDNVVQTYDKLAKKYNWEINAEDEDYQGCFMPNSTNEYFMILPFNADLKLISHEVLHGTFAILEDHGVTLGPDSEEAFTYLHDYIIGKVQDKLI